MISPATWTSFSKWLSWSRDTTTPNSMSLGWRSSKDLYKFENTKEPQTTFTQLITWRVKHHWDMSHTGPLWVRKSPSVMESLDMMTQHIVHSDNLKMRKLPPQAACNIYRLTPSLWTPPCSREMRSEQMGHQLPAATADHALTPGPPPSKSP